MTTYNQNQYLDQLSEKCNVKHDAALCRLLQVAPPIVSKYRHGRLAISAGFMIRVMDITGISIMEQRTMLGCKRMVWRLSNEPVKVLKEAA